MSILNQNSEEEDSQPINQVKTENSTLLTGIFLKKIEKKIQINKIQIIPRRENDRVFGGYVYVVEDDWAIYGADLTVTGAQINNPAIDVLHIKQNYNYEPNSGIWALILQTIDFKVGFLGFNIDGSQDMEKFFARRKEGVERSGTSNSFKRGGG